jgi:hypothetical protein
VWDLKVRTWFPKDPMEFPFAIPLMKYSIRYKLKVTFGEISLKLRQTNWNVARIKVNVVVGDGLPSQIIVYSCFTIDIWTQQRRCTSMQFYALRSHPHKMVGFHTSWRQKMSTLLWKPRLAGKRLVRTMQCTQFHAKSAKNDLRTTNFLKRNFCFETDGVLNLKNFIQDLQVHGSQHFIQHEGFQALPKGKRNQH